MEGEKTIRQSRPRGMVHSGSAADIAFSDGSIFRAFERREHIRVAHVEPIYATGSRAESEQRPAAPAITPSYARAAPYGDKDVGSIIIVVATDAPLLPHQMKRLARRASLGLARTGSNSGNGSGDIFIAFSTANPNAGNSTGLANLTMLPNDLMDRVFEATVQATEESIVNAMEGAQTMTGFAGHKVFSLPHGQLRQVLEKYNRLSH